MVAAGLILIIIGLVVEIVLGVWAQVKVSRKYNGIVQEINDYLNGDGQPSRFNQDLDNVTSMIAEKLRIAVTNTHKGAAGAAARDMSRGLQEIAIQEQPELGLLGAMPKAIQKNPLALAGLQILMKNMAQRPGPAGSWGGGPSGRPGDNGSLGVSDSIKF